MSNALRSAIHAALDAANRAADDPLAAFAALERAHILSQRLPVLHAYSHWRMLRLGWQLRDWREVAGQLPRIIAALLFSRLWVPIGNSGRARISAFARQPLSAELQRLLDEGSNRKQ